MAEYGSDIERIATNAATAATRRTQQMEGLIRQYVRQQQSGMGGGMRIDKPGEALRGGPPVGINIGPTHGYHGNAHGKIRPNAPIVSIRDGQGHTVQVNKSVADDFKAFLRALKRTGYDIHSIGGYANRNIAGTNTRSLHSYGLAIDINPSANPVTYGRRSTNLPRGIGRLAARYGIAWGGNWNGSKKDTMHFSFPYFGTK